MFHDVVDCAAVQENNCVSLSARLFDLFLDLFNQLQIFLHKIVV